MPNPHRGEVTFTVNGEDYTVRPTFQVIAEIENQFGGIMPLAKRMAAGDFTITEIVGVMLIALRGVKDAPKSALLQEKIFEEGVTNFLNPVASFLANALTSGGQGGGSRGREGNVTKAEEVREAI